MLINSRNRTHHRCFISLIINEHYLVHTVIYLICDKDQGFLKKKNQKADVRFQAYFVLITEIYSS